VGVKVGVKEGVFVRVGGFVLVSVGFGVRVLVGVRDFVGVYMGVRVGEEVEDGSTRIVFVGTMVGDGIRVSVWVGIWVGVDVISVCTCCKASASDTGTISLCEQYFPVIVQAISSSSCVSGSGFDGAPID